ncbi:MAG: ribonuclease P protein subunit [Nitrososphaerota archaeon]|nr:ribonuclease P protein subunit [Nitrososphaerota archaeon]MDG6966730.1 ribonuclease P protein subunit [Nitrososphaerota archaeon]MDG6979209.1 ribonuclease P protein subunit [Nitrososphaerota archaeon]MDG7022335.1 ribonuclease P protein subunit [Nitrososphaerota archaeon]
MISIIGEDVRLAASRGAMNLGLKGRIVLESMHTVTIRTADRRTVMVPKLGSAFELAGGRILLGDDLEGRLEDRMAAGRRRR